MTVTEQQEVEQKAEEVHSSAAGTHSRNGMGNQWVGFFVAGEEYAVDIYSVQEIKRPLEVTHVPGAPDFIDGVMNLRGIILPVIRMRKRLDLPDKSDDRETRIVVVNVGEQVLGLVVDRVSEVMTIPEEQILPPPTVMSGGGSEYILGVGRIEDRILILLDIEKLFLHPMPVVPVGMD